MQTKTFAVMIIFFSSLMSFGKGLEVNPQYACTLKVEEVAERANQIYKDNQNVFPETLLVQPIEMEYQDGSLKGTVEGFFRPAVDMSIQLSEKAKVQLRLDHDHDLIYLCGHYNAQNLQNSHITVYFLRGVGLSGENSRSNRIEAYLFGGQIRIAPARIGFDGVMLLPHLVEQILEKIPGVNILYSLFQGIILSPVRILGKTALQISRLDVEGVVLSTQGYELESDVLRGQESIVDSFSMKP